MDQTMITLVTDMCFSLKRLEEIFAVPKTKQLFEQLTKQEKNEEQIKELTQKLEKMSEIAGANVQKENMDMRLKVCILAASIESVIRGKSLNQAIQATLKEQLRETTVIEKVAKDINKLEKLLYCRAATQSFVDCVKNMLS